MRALFVFVALCTSAPVLEAAIAASTHRHSGLLARLSEAAPPAVSE